jgi:hypothetical protein
MAKGGPREGMSGAAYPNRTDMQGGTQPVRAPSGGEYGDRKRLEGLQQAMPLPNLADKVVPIDAPTARPNEPVTAGAPIGPGPGPEVLGPTYLGITDDSELEIREMIGRFPQYAAYLDRLLDYYT